LSYDNSFLTNLYKENFKQLWSYAYKLTKNDSHADDIIQSVFENFIKHEKTLCKLDAAQRRVYMYTSVKHAVYRLLDGNKRTINVDDSFFHAMADKSDTEDIVMQKIKQEQLRLLVDKLPEKYQDVIVLRYYLDLSHKEIARIMQIKTKYVSTLLNRARANLKLLMGGTYER